MIKNDRFDALPAGNDSQIVRVPPAHPAEPQLEFEFICDGFESKAARWQHLRLRLATGAARPTLVASGVSATALLGVVLAPTHAVQVAAGAIVILPIVTLVGQLMARRPRKPV